MSDHGQRIELATLLVRLSETWARLARQIAVDIKQNYEAVQPGHLLLLQLLDTYGPQRMSDLAMMLGMSVGGSTLLVDRAVEANLVRRERDSADRRIVRINLDERGERQLAATRQATAQLLTGYLAHLDRLDVENYHALLERMLAASTSSPQKPRAES